MESGKRFISIRRKEFFITLLLILVATLFFVGNKPAAASTGTGQITGTVQDSNSNPISGVNVFAYDNNYEVFSAVTDENGNYTLTDLGSDSYKVRFDPDAVNYQNSLNYVGEWYSKQSDMGQALPVSVKDGETTGNIDAQLAVGGSISGTVVDPQGTPITNPMDIEILDATTNDYVAGVQSDYQGQYSIRGLPQGRYKVEFYTDGYNYNYDSNYLTNWYPNQTDISSASAVTVTAGQDVTHIDAKLQAGGSITGKVSDPSGNPVVNFSVEAYDNNGNYVTSIATDDSGNYTLKGLVSGTYKIGFDTQYYNDYNNTSFLTTWYNNKTDVSSATPVQVMAGTDTSDINVTLQVGGSISGTVTDPSGNPVADLGIYAAKSNGDYAGYIYTDSNGNYSLKGLAADSYKVQFDTHYYNSQNNTNYLASWYDNQQDYDLAKSIQVTLGQDTPNINAKLQVGGSISGKVTDPSGNPLDGLWINALDSNGSYVGYAYTDSDGNYSIRGLAADTYRIEFDTASYNTDNNTSYLASWYDNQLDRDSAKPVQVTLGQDTPNINAKLQVGGSISGKVTDPSGNPLANLWINALDSNGNYVGSAYTDSDGNYSVKGLTADTYKIEFNATSYNDNNNTSYMGSWYDNQPNSVSAKPVLVTLGQDTPNINAKLQIGGSISGKVVDPSDQPVTNMEVIVTDNNGYSIADDWTDNNGAYSVRGLAADTYKVQFVTADYNMQNDTNYMESWYDNQPNRVSAKPVQVTLGQDTPNINAKLQLGGSISGKVIDPSGQPVTDIEVVVTDNNGNYIADNWTDNNGAYSVKGLTTGGYKVQLNTQYYNDGHGTNYRPFWYNNQLDSSSANLVDVTAGQDTPDINAKLQLGGSITGKVTDANGKPLQGIDVSAEGDASGYYSSTDANGNYVINGLPGGQYRVQFDPYSYNQQNNTNYLPQWYDQQSDYQSAKVVTVGEGTVIGNINGKLVLGGSISGIVTDSLSKPISGMSVYVKNTDSSSDYYYMSADTDTSGHFTIAGLKPGQYKVYVDSDSFNRINSTNYAPQWYNLKTADSAADIVTVKSGLDSQGVNFQLVQGGTISGTVLDFNGKVVPGLDVYVYDTDYNYVSDAQTDSLGKYTVKGLITGKYKVLFGAPWYNEQNKTNYSVQWYNGKASFAQADAVAVTISKDTPNINATLQQGGSISGTITDPSGKPVSNMGVSVYSTDTSPNSPYGQTDGAAFTDSQGNYTVTGLRPGTYKIEYNTQWFNGDNNTNYAVQWYKGQLGFATASVVTVTAGKTTANLNDQLKIGGGSISGTVTDQNNQPISDLDISVVDSNNNLIGYAFTDSNGKYKISYLTAGGYKVSFDTAWHNTQYHTHYVSSWYQNKLNFDQAVPITVAANQETSNVNGKLQTGGDITGVVTAANGAKLANLEVDVYDLNNNLVSTAYTNYNGVYTVTELPGNYKVYFNPNDYNKVIGTDYSNQWFTGKTSFSDASPVTVSLNQVTQNINAQLQTGPALSVDSPKDNLVTSQPTITVSGKVHSGSTVSVNTINVTPDFNGNFSTAVKLVEGDNSIKIAATSNGSTVSVTRKVTLDTKAPTVTATPTGGAYFTTQSVKLAASESAVIYYTTNGSEPTVDSTVYSSPISISSPVTLKYIAIDLAGNKSSVYSQSYTFTGKPNSTGMLNFKSDGIHFSPALVWDSSPYGFVWSKVKEVAGDFNGDKKSDIAVLYDYGNNQSGIWLFLSNGTTYSPSLVWKSNVGGFAWSRSKLTAQDVNGDGKDDICILYDYGNKQSGLWVFQSNGKSVIPYLAWKSGKGAYDWQSIKLTGGDFNGDGKGDVGAFYNYGNNQSGLWTFLSNAKSFTPTLAWKSNVGGFAWQNSAITSGDFNGDGKADVAVMYNYGKNQTGFWNFLSTGKTFSPTLAWKSTVGGFAWSNSLLTNGDYNGDGKDDLGVLYNYGNNQSGLWKFTSNGTKFASSLAWKGDMVWSRSKVISGDFDANKKVDIQLIYSY